MNNTIKKIATLFVVLTLTGGIASTTTAYDENTNSKGHKSFVGTWDSNIDFFGTIFRAMYSFHRGGTLTESDNPAFDPAFGGDALSPGLGVWERVSRKRVKAKYRKLAYNADGQLTLVYTSSLDLKLKKKRKKDTWIGTLSIDISQPDGTLVNQFLDLPITANRLTVD